MWKDYFSKSAMDSPLDKLATQAKNGDKKAEVELFQYLSVRFRTIAKRRIGERDAEDIAQEAALTVLEKYKTATYPKGFAAWAYKVLRNKIGNYLQKRKDLEKEGETEKVTNASTARHDCDLRMRLIKCFRQMIRRNRDYARVLNLVYQGYKTDEICRRLQITSNNLYVILSRGRKLMKICLEKGVM